MARPSTLRATKVHRGASLSVLFALVIPVLLLAVGLGVDGAAKVSAARRAEAAAASAARAGVDAAAHLVVASSPQATGMARQAAEQSLIRDGVSGTVAVEQGTIIVDTSLAVPTVFVSLAGINQVEGHGHASAQLVPR